MNRMYAFTLLELLASLAIISVVIALAMPSLTQSVTRHRSHYIAVSLHNFLQFARNSALTEGKVHTVCASEDMQQCINSANWSNRNLLLFIDNNRNGQRDNDDNIVQVLMLHSYQAQLYWRSFGNKPYLQWQANGMLYYQNGSFLYCPSNNDTHFAFLLTLNAIGRMYFASDKNNDGIVEGSDGKNVVCP